MSTGAPQLGHFSSVLLFDADLTNDNLYIVPIISLTNEELNELEEEHMNYPKILDKLHSYDYDTPKSRVLTK